ncbi:MAG: hypothetical protein ACK57B_02525 [Betaproteobacteria bacterium]|jgi:hypothetical protein
MSKARARSRALQARCAGLRQLNGARACMTTTSPVADTPAPDADGLLIGVGPAGSSVATLRACVPPLHNHDAVARENVPGPSF